MNNPRKNSKRNIGNIYYAQSSMPNHNHNALKRRQQLLEIASQLDALVVEDDYEFEISSKNQPHQL